MTFPTEKEIAFECRFFLGDRPCAWHKREGCLCRCQHYQPVTGKILLIKLDAAGDVLRTTCLLPPMTRKWPDAALTWITRPDSVPLLDNNPYLTEVIPYGPDAVVQLTSRVFDQVINLDAGKISGGLASMARAKIKTGYALHEDGYVQPCSREAEDWFRMGIFDDLKQSNKKTYQEIMCEILGLGKEGLAYVLKITDEEHRQAFEHLSRLGADISKPILGIHTGGGERWPLKQWTEKGFTNLIDLLSEKGVQVLLLGGTAERERNERILSSVKEHVFDGGCDNSLRHFAGLIGHCDVILSGDSLAMHIALAMNRRVVVLFGPTSHAEIELFGKGEKIVPDLDCLSCYRTSCDVRPNCMESISVPSVYEAISRQFGAAGKKFESLKV